MKIWDKFLEVNSILLLLGFGGVIGLLKSTFNQFKKNGERLKTDKEATEQRFQKLEYANIAILHDKIYNRCNDGLKDGWISVDDLENLEYLWRGYKGLGGNGTGETIYNEVLKLPKLPPKKGGN